MEIYYLFCFLTIRYSDEVDINHVQHTLANEILLGLLWHEFLLSASSNNQDSFSGYGLDLLKNSTQPTSEELKEAANTKHAMDYVESLGKCIVKILTGIHCMKNDLFLLFAKKFQVDCLDLFQQKEHSSQNVQWVVNFILLLDKHAVQGGETWPLLDLVGPALRKAFPLIGTLVSFSSQFIYSLFIFLVLPYII